MTKNEMLLLQLAEECCEVGQAVSKQLRFGPNNTWPSQDGTANHRIMVELIDLLTLIDICQQEQILPQWATLDVEKLKQLKREKVEKYLLYSQDRGTLL